LKRATASDSCKLLGTNKFRALPWQSVFTINRKGFELGIEKNSCRENTTFRLESSHSISPDGRRKESSGPQTTKRSKGEDWMQNM
jgi:hypothetical protein